MSARRYTVDRGSFGPEGGKAWIVWDEQDRRVRGLVPYEARGPGQRRRDGGRTMSAQRIVNRALAFEAEGFEPAEAFRHACDHVQGLAPAVYERARRTLDALARRAGRVEVVLPERGTDGRFRRG